MEDGTDEEDIRAARLDGWVIWETEECVVPRALD